jgi:hypothetical protein
MFFTLRGGKFDKYLNLQAATDGKIHWLLFSMLDNDKVTPESMLSGYGMRINVSKEGTDIIP